MKTINPPSVSWFQLRGKRPRKRPLALPLFLAVAFSSLLLGGAIAHADLGYLSIDPPMASTPIPTTDLGSATQLLGVDGSNAVGSFNDVNGDTWSFIQYGPSYVILNDPSGANSYTVAGIGGNTAFGSYSDSNNVDHGFITTDGTNYTTVDFPSAQSGSTTIVGVSGSNVAGTYTDTTTNSEDNGFLFDGTNYTQIDVTNSLTITNASEGSTSIAGISGGKIVGNYTDDTNSDHGFLFDGTNYTQIDVTNGVVGSTTVVGISGNLIVGNYLDTDSNAVGFLFDGTNYTSIDDSNAILGGTTVVGISGSIVAGNFNDTDGNAHGFFFDGTNYTTLDDNDPAAQSNTTVVTGIAGGKVYGSYQDINSDTCNFIYDLTTGTYTTFQGPPDGTTVTGASGLNAFGTYADIFGNTNAFLFDGANYTTIDDPNGAPGSTTIVGISGNNVAGTYTETNSGNGFTYGFVAFGGTNYTDILGPQGADAFNNGGGLDSINGISGNNVAGTYTDTNSGNIYGFLTADGTHYTLLKGPVGYDGSSMAIAGVQGTTVVGSYSDTNGNFFGFKNSTPVAGPAGVVDGSSTLLGINGITANGNIVGTYSDPVSGNTYGFIGASILRGPDGTNGTGIDTIDAIAGNSVAGTYTDMNSQNTYGYVYSGGSYGVISGPDGTNGGGIDSINGVLGVTAVGNYTDSNSVAHGFFFDGTNSTPIDFPGAQDGGTVVNGISSTGTIYGTYTDEFGLTHGFYIIQRLPQSITFGGNPTATYGLPVTLNATSKSGLPITYTVSGPATISNNVLTFTGTGSVQVVATQLGNPYYSPAGPVTNTITVNKASQVIGNFSVPNAVFGAAPFTVTPPTASSGLPVTLSLVSGPISFNSNVVTILGAGTVTLAANQGGNTNYNAAPQVTSSFVINKAPQTLAPFASIGSQPFGTNFTVTPPAGNTNSGQPVSLSILSGPATISGNTVTPTGVGTVLIAANQPGNANYLPATTVTTAVPITQASQTIAAFTNIPKSIVFGTNFTVTPPVASSGLPVSLLVLSGPAAISGNKIVPTGVGLVTLAANQPGNGNYAAAPQVTTSFSVTQTPQSLGTFGAIPAKTFGNAPFIVTPPKAVGANSGQAVLLSVLSGPATIAGNTVTLTGAGTVTLAADLAANANFAAAPEVTTNFVVSPATQTLGAWSVPAQTYSSNATVSVTPPVASSGLPVTVSVQSGPASILSNTVTLTGAGTVTLSAVQSGSVNYNSSTNSTVSFVVNKSAQAISFPTIANVLGTDPVTITNLPTASSGLPVTVTVLSTNATYDSNQNVVTLIGTNGTVVLAANQSGNANYLAAPQVTTSFSFGKIDQSFTNSFGTLSDVVYSNNETVTVTLPSASSGLPATLSVLSGPATLSSTNSVTITGAGTVVLAADQAGNSMFGPAAEVTTSFNVTQASQTLGTFTPPASVNYGSTLAITLPTASSGLPVNLSVLSGPGVLVGNKLTITGSGTNIVLVANQSGNANYTAASPVSNSIPVVNIPQTIAPFSSIPTQTYASNATVTVTPPVASSGLTPTLKVVSGPATITGNVVTLNGVGTVVLAANVPRNGTYLAAPQVTTSFAVVKASQTISSFGTISDVPYGTPSITISNPPTSDSGLPVALSVLSGPATISGNTVTLKGAGTVILAANQTGNANYLPASRVTISFNVTQIAQTIGSFSLADRVYSTTPFVLPAITASSGLPVTFSVVSGPAKIAGNKVTMTGVGTVVIAANQTGNANYSAATPVMASFQVTQVPQAITAFATISTKTFGSAPFTIAIPTASSGLPVTVTVLSGPATISGNKVTLTGKGTVVLAANQSGSAIYAPASQVTATFTVK